MECHKLESPNLPDVINKRSLKNKQKQQGQFTKQGTDLGQTFTKKVINNKCRSDVRARLPFQVSLTEKVQRRGNP